MGNLSHVSGTRHNRAVAKFDAAGLLEIEPDLAELLTNEQCAVAAGFRLPVATLESDGDAEALVEQAGAFGGLVLDGLIVQTVQLDQYKTLRVIGPGGLLPLERAGYPLQITDSRLLATTPTRLVMLGRRFLIATQHWPWLTMCLHRRMLEQAARLRTQLAICQLPRVEGRLMAMMRLLAESWGHVTPAGVRLELSLSHETLGGLIGARRPTVSLALKALAERGALVRQGDTWLILDAQPPAAVCTEEHAPQLLPIGHSNGWAAQDPASVDESQALLAPVDVARTREDCAHHRQRARHLQQRAAVLCEQSRRLVTQLSDSG